MSKKAALLFLAVGLAVVAGVALLSSVRARKTSAAHACVSNLWQIDGAKSQWRLENHKTANDVPRWDDLLPYLYLRQKPRCPQGGTYILVRVGERPRCSFGGAHTLPQ